ILVGAGTRCAVSEKIERNATSQSGELLDQGIPEMAVEENAVDENCSRARARLAVTDLSELGRDVLIRHGRKWLLLRHVSSSSGDHEVKGVGGVAYAALGRSGALGLQAVNRPNKALMKGTAVPKIDVMSNAFPNALPGP